MDDDRVEVTGRIVLLHDSSLEIVAELVCENEVLAQSCASLLRGLIAKGFITQIN